MLRKIALIAALAATPAFASDDILRIEAEGDVATVMDRLEAAVAGAGATVFARVDHGQGAASVDMELADAELLIFGNPKLGTPAMQADMHAGIFLPLRVLVYADSDGQTWLAYEAPREMLDDLSIPADAPFLGAMEGALQKLTGVAAGG
ncbi:DUF302 domain-containing protein [Ovoidimarina sediminis]|uniref:DUF302 domain-containing protein n=1 Tax=Ovoidimarina sediminis TaxID=3079856 RepID=UPI002912C163|nr:DUF302 domain-containing protein [Rhodophyticola sp. MJ-SS7]MDU8944838.1 DUF302 domain-containing protein [Rhodophyticola sp. MJ-SS7]